MAPRRKGGGRADISPELRARIAELSTLLWGGNRSRMARDVGVDQPTVSRVLAGEQKPSARLLEKLATRPGVNVGWLLLGQGEPLAGTGGRAGAGGYRPLLDELLPGPPEECRELLGGVSYPVAAAFETPTSYWYRVPANSPVTAGDYKVRAGDLLLIEAGEGATRKGAAVTGRFCAFRVREGKKLEVGLWWVDAFDHSTAMEGYEQYRVDRFGKKGEESWLIIPLDPEGEGRARRSLAGRCLTLAEVVGVGVKLERPFTRQGGRGA